MPEDIDEETALLSKRGSKSRTPLPTFQLSVIMLIQICEPIASQSIYPYINQLVSELDITGGDEKKVGYYACESLFFLTEAMTVLQWSRASDHFGRKPILLIGLFGTGLSIFCFGLSRTFWALVASRCLCGLLSGNIGVMKSAVGDLTDRTNRADAFSYIPIVWAIGASLGPLAGGALARPHDRFPEIFSGTFWRDFPYLLPCIATGSFVFLSCYVVLIFFKETAPSGNQKSWVQARDEDEGIMQKDHKCTGPLPLRALLLFPVIISISNYAALAFLSTTLACLLPLFLAMKIEIGGLGLPPPAIGFILSAYGLTTGLFQFLFSARLVRRFGEKRVFATGMIACLPVFVLLPIMSMIARRSGLTIVIWALVGCVLVLGAILDTSFVAIFVFITASAPKSSRGTVNGLSQTYAALARAIAPALSTSLFSLSVQHNLLGGYFIYFVFLVISGLSLVLAESLPDQVWDDFE
ncbi:major facilitator superfamily domain-containing protein [Mycena maculata]|uniref:Major facilitator superfamily domain-containing protein n=1 Tax=Mycena maculata TaxID=230809 RepID=A0AAD7HAP6_9AGAR|nr:major facilitator superfamily domain-containing protein [Mycena maculata]